MAIMESELRDIRFQCIGLALAAVRDRIGRKDSASPTDTEVLDTAKKFEEYVLGPEPKRSE